MSMKDDSDGGNFRHFFTMQLKQFDNQLSEFRQFYESHSTEERKQLREWLEQISELQRAARWNMRIQIHAENDIFDGDDELIRWADAVFAPATMLSAISAWDAGNNFTPSSALP